jgi:hypothetical protein
LAIIRRFVSVRKITGNPPSGGKKPGTPTIGTATAADASATVAYTAPSYTGKGGAVTYTATSNPGSKTGTGTSPITVFGLTNGTSYTFTVVAGTSYDVNSDASFASNSVTPAVPNNSNIELVLVAGGGSGGRSGNGGGGGGAGGLLTYSAFTVSAGTKYSVTIGGGGGTTTTSGNRGANGTNTTFTNATTAVGGGGGGGGSQVTGSSGGCRWWV